MDSFEYITARILEAEGYWTKVGVKIEVTKEEKRSLGNPSMPRPEVDVVAFKPRKNELLLIECKSYLDSGGITLEYLSRTGKYASRLKFFNHRALRNLVERKIVKQLQAQGALSRRRPYLRWELFAGRIKRDQEQKVTEKLRNSGWSLRTPAKIAEALRRFAEHGYEDEVSTVVTKLLERNVAALATEGT